MTDEEFIRWLNALPIRRVLVEKETGPALPERPTLADYARSVHTAVANWPRESVTRERMLLLASKLDALHEKNPHATLRELCVSGGSDAAG